MHRKAVTSAKQDVDVSALDIPAELAYVISRTHGKHAIVYLHKKNILLFHVQTVRMAV